VELWYHGGCNTDLREEPVMTIQFDAVYQDGVFRPMQPVAIPNGAEVTVVVQSRQATSDPLAGVIGIDDGPVAGDVADQHDNYIHGRG
jgi:predicted DNA-binding antitoxin AbrB/MazE fold protein